MGSSVSTPLLIEDLVSSYRWLRKNRLIHDDPVLEQLPSPDLVIEGKRYISFCSNNYLGLNKRPEILEAAKEAVERYGIGTCESRKLGGNLFILEELEKKLAHFKGTESAMIFATGLMANVGVIPAITDILFYMELFYGKKNTTEPPVILSDELNHRSIQMGNKLSRAEVCKYEHSNMNSLKICLERYKGRRILIVTDGVFSMDGDLADLPSITHLASEYRAAVMVDDAHATGVWGETGRGSAEHYHVEDEVHIKMGTLSKAFGSMGGFIAGDSDVIKMLKENTSTYYFTSSLPAEQAAGLIVATDIIEREGRQLRKKLWGNVDHVIRGICEIGLEIPLRWTQIIPIIIGDEKLCFDAEKILLSEGVLVSSATVPAVAPGQARLRVTVNSCHTSEHIEALLEGLKKVVRMLKIPTKTISDEEWSQLQSTIPPYMQALISE